MHGNINITCLIGMDIKGQCFSMTVLHDDPSSAILELDRIFHEYTGIEHTRKLGNLIPPDLPMPTACITDSSWLS